MHIPYKKIAAVAAAIACMPFIAACGKTEEIVKTGIEVVEQGQEDYTEEQAEALQNSIYDLLCTVATATSGISPLPASTLSTLYGYAADATAAITDAVSDGPAIEQLCGVLSSQSAGEAAQSLDLAALTALYAQITAAAGFDGAGRIAYNLVLCYYDIIYQKYMAQYETYGYPYLEARALAAAEEREDIVNYVGCENFSLAVRTLCALAQFGRSGTGTFDLLTEGELLALLQAQKMTGLELQAEGWLSLMKFAGRLTANTYAGKIIACADGAGDLELIAENMNALFELLRTVQQNLTVKQAAMLMDGRTGDFVTAAYAALDEGGRELFVKVTSLSLSGDYNAIAESRYGGEYSAYIQNTTTYTAEELEAAAGSDNFIAILEGYVAGNLPLAAFELFYDRA